MALINCSECGKEVSDKAQNCIHCGCPILQERESEKKVEFQKPDVNIDGIKDKIKKIATTIGPKKLAIIAAVIAVVIILASLPLSGGLGSSGKEIVLNEIHKIDGIGELEIYRVSTTDHLFEQEQTGKTYIVFDCSFTNKTSSAFAVDNVAVFSAKSKKTGAVYANYEIGEVALANVVGVVAEPNVKTKVQFIVEIAKDEGDVVVTFGFENKSLNFKYTVGDLIRNAEPFDIGSSIEVEDVAKVEINNIVYSEGIWAPNPYSGRTHRGYCVDDSNQTAYLIIDTMYTNLMHMIQCPQDRGEGPVEVEIVYQDKYYYTSDKYYVFTYNDTSVDTAWYKESLYIPNSSVRTCVVIEVPMSIIEEEAEIIMYVGDKEYTYKGTPSYVEKYGMK